MATRLAPRRFVGVALIRLSWLTVFLFALIGLASISNKVKTQLAPSDIRDSISQLNEPLESKSLERNFMDTRDDGSSERRGKRTEATKKNVANVFPEVDSIAKGFESQLTTISTRTISKLADSSQAIPMGQTDLGRHSNQSTTSSVSLQTSSNRSNDSSNVSTSNTSAYNEAELRFVRGIMITNSLICAIGMCGNAIVVLVILKFTRVETVTDIYILNLAFADLMFVAGLIFLITTMYKGDWVFGSTMCKVSKATDGSAESPSELTESKARSELESDDPNLDFHVNHLAQSICLKSTVGCDVIRSLPRCLPSHLCPEIQAASSSQDNLHVHLDRLSHPHDSDCEYIVNLQRAYCARAL